MLPLRPDMASLTVGSNNFPTRVYENPPDLVDWLGRQSSEQVLKLIQAATVVVMPSEWYETFGRIIMESFACGTPVETICSAPEPSCESLVVWKVPAWLPVLLQPLSLFSKDPLLAIGPMIPPVELNPKPVRQLSGK